MTTPSTIKRIGPAEARRRQQGGALLIDVREHHERMLGFAAGAAGVARADLEADPLRTVPQRSTPVMLICQVGGRSLKAAEALAAAGYTDVAVVEGGTTRWIADGLPVERPDGEVDFFERYSRHLRLPEVGEAGQRRLQAARVAMVGAGGLGSPAAYYLAAAGVGSLVLADDDVVDRSNLQRQILHTDARIGHAEGRVGAHRPVGPEPDDRPRSVRRAHRGRTTLNG